MDTKQGFTLLELLIVTTLVATIAAIAIPNLLSASKPANESSAISTLRALNIVNEQYRLRFSSYAGSLANLATERYIDDKVGAGTKSGYSFTYTPGTNTWSCNGDPSAPGATGDNHFFVDQGGVIRFKSSGTASSTDQPVD
jgi:prepilin-type N-terminal cleavage/methylation domain-containing protein